MKKSIVLILLLVGVLALLGGCKAKEEELPADAITLNSTQTVRNVEAYGVIKALDVKNITIGFPAAIEKINVKNGQKVATGDTLMELNVDDYNAQLKSQECDINLQKDQQKEQEKLMKEQENLTEEQENLMKDQEAKLSALEDNLALQKGKLEQANIKQDQIVSDIENGIVFNIANVEGDMVYPGYRLASIANLYSLIVSANIDQQFIGWVVEGAKVDITPEYDKNTVINGTVSFISSKTFMNNGETVVPVEITFDSIPEGIILDSDVQIKIYPAEAAK